MVGDKTMELQVELEDHHPRDERKEKKVRACEWVKVMFTITDQDLIDKCNEDSFVYLMFLRYTIIFFSVISLLSFGILMPIYSTGYSSLVWSEFSQISVLSCAEDKTRMWGVFSITFGVNILV